MAGVRSGGKRSASRGYFSNVFFFVRNPFFIRRGNLPAGLVFNAFFLFYACRLKGSFNGLRVLGQGFDKDKSLWGGKAGIGEEEAPFLKEGPPPSPEFRSGKKEQEGGGLPNRKKINILSRNTSCSGTVSGLGDGGSASLATRKKQWNRLLLNSGNNGP